MKSWIATVTLCLILCVSSPGFGREAEDAISEVPAKGMVTMVDLGAERCIPCRMMAPILKELKEEYEGRAAILFIDVSKHRDQMYKYKISAIPTQVFFGKDGREASRHVGFMDKKSIVKVLKEMGVE